LLTFFLIQSMSNGWLCLLPISTLITSLPDSFERHAYIRPTRWLPSENLNLRTPSIGFALWLVHASSNPWLTSANIFRAGSNVGMSHNWSIEPAQSLTVGSRHSTSRARSSFPLRFLRD